METAQDFDTVECRSDGVSPFFCLSMFPVHDTATQQSSQSPFFIHVGEASFRPSQHINVTLTSYDERPFIGVIMNAQLAGTDDIVGSFLVYPDNRTKTGSCSGNSKNYITHSDNKPVTNIEVTWIAPGEDIGPITFRATFMESFNVFWINVETDVAPEQAPSVQTQDPEIAKRPIDLDLDGCGSESGCMLYPGFCFGLECDTGVTFEMYSEHIHFNMWARTSESAYVSIGFSHDRLMRGRVTDMATEYRDGSLYCSFTIPIIVNVTTVNESLATYDLHNPYHVMLAYGRLYEGTDVIAKHDELPIQSINKIAFDVIGIHRANALPLITQIHVRS
ncbi:ferric-chelate reductase 1-like [Argopecten irradians]|uniref:ferric-chelate reductase 1-like n=1 Tax=Argopecten irradians TaxID=31199 RepID=UPI0037203CAF